MAENNNKLNQLTEQLEWLLKRHENFSLEINELRKEINKLKSADIKPLQEERKETEVPLPRTIPIAEVEKEPAQPDFQAAYNKTFQEESKLVFPQAPSTPKVKSDLEKFIGENLINKIGIAITVIGIAIGAKYSIEHDLISPLTRIILGYMSGLALLGFGIKLKKNYEKYSAVLVSGAISIMYFITYAAYSFYNLVPQPVAFFMMVIFTAFTVVAAIRYNQQVIAHIGLVGAYAVPFLLSDGSGRVAILFTYTSIINIGILVISIKRYWKSLYYSSFILTWIIYISWYATGYRTAEHFQISLVFLSVFFATFYLILLVYKLLEKEKFEKSDIIMLLSNSFIFYGLGYSILSRHETGEQLLGLFTLCNGIIHFFVSVVIYRQKLADRNLFYLIAGLVLVFITIAIPVQLEGNWVTVLWAGEAALLFWIGRTKNVAIYEKISYVLMLLAFVSLVQDWSIIYDNWQMPSPGIWITPIFNINFLTSVLFIAAFAFINYINNYRKNASSIFKQPELNSFISYSIPAIILIVLYVSFRMEISTYWMQMYQASFTQITREGHENPDQYWNYDMLRFNTVWIINYTLLFLTILSFVNMHKLKNRSLGLINIGINTFALFVFLIQGLYSLSELRTTYLDHVQAEFYQRSAFNIGIRYVSFAFVLMIVVATYRYIRQDFIKPLTFNLRLMFELGLSVTLVWIASSELIAWMHFTDVSESYKLGLSILWGVSSLILIATGILKKKKHLRIAAIILFGLTLIKLFFYDISHLNTISKPIVFVSLGVLLLIISFLYNKYKVHLSEENEK